MGCNQSTPPTRPTSSVPAVEETRYQITFLLEHEIIGEFGEKIITNPLNSSSDSYKKEMKQNVYIKSIHSSVAKYVQSYGMKVGDIIETISVEGPDGFEHEVINLDDTTKSLLNSERPITVTCCRKRYNEKLLQYWKWRIRKDTNKNGYLGLNNQGITTNDGIIIGELLKTNKSVNIIIYGKNSNDETIYTKYNQLKKLGFTNAKLYIGGLFEWLLLQDIYGDNEFPTTTYNLDILKYSGDACESIRKNYVKTQVKSIASQIKS